MAIRHIPEGEDFEHPADFGFTGSAKKTAHRAHGGGVHHVEHHADGGHTVHHHDGSRVEHHADGGMTHHHGDGGMTHHHPDGSVAHHHPHGLVTIHRADGGITHHHPDGSVEHHDASELAHRHHHAQDGDVAEDKAMVEKGIHQHENHEHGGEHTDLHLARGGIGGRRPPLPRGMKPMAAHARSPIGRAPKASPMMTPMPAGGEPDIGGPDMGAPAGPPQGLARGGRRRGY